MINIVKDNSDEVLAELKNKTTLALDAVGAKAVSDVQILTPVDTGDLWNSIDHVVDDNKVVIGTNVEYAIYVELRDKAKHPTGQAHFLRDGITRNLQSYRDIVRKYLSD